MLSDYLSNLRLPSGTEDSSSKISTYLTDCINAVNSGDVYNAELTCKKSCEYYIRQEADKFQDLSESEWQNFADYVLIKSPGESVQTWTDYYGKLQINHNWKELIKDKLNFNFNQCSDNSEICSDCWINWRALGYDKEPADANRARDDYWKWSEAEKSKQRLAGISSPIGEAATKGKEILDTYITPLKTYAENYANNPDNLDEVYKLAYQLRLSEAYFNGLREEYKENTDLLKEIGDYVTINGPGKAQTWLDQFGEIQLGNLIVFEKGEGTDRKELNFNHWCDDYSCGLSIWFNWGRTSKEAKKKIQEANTNAENEARDLEKAGMIKEYKKTFSISEENEKIAKSLKDEINTAVNKLKDFSSSPSKENAYKAVYDSEIIRTKLDGYREAFEYKEMQEICPYLLLYTTGTLNIWYDPMVEEYKLDNKELYKDTNFNIGLNCGCDDYNEECWMNIWTGTEKQFEKDYKIEINRARNDAMQEAEKLRRLHLLIKARKSAEERNIFSDEIEEISNEIIEKLNTFTDKIKAFELEPSSDKAYKLQYEYVLLRSELEGYRDAWRDKAEIIGEYMILYGPGIADIWKNQYDEIEIGHHSMIYSGKIETVKKTTTGTTDKGVISRGIELHFNWWYDENREEGGFDLWLDLGRFAKTYKKEVNTAEKEAWKEADKLRKLRLASRLLSDLENEGISADLEVSAINKFIEKAKAYKTSASVTAYDVELARLTANGQMEKLDSNKADYIFVSTEGYPEIWYDWETDELNLGGWKEELVKTEYLSANMGKWCHPVEEWCRTEIILEWKNWKTVESELRRANENFWKQKREAEFLDKISVIKNTKTEYSSIDQALINELVSTANGLSSLAEKYKNKEITTEEFQYQLLVKRDEINEKLDSAEKQSLVEVVIAEIAGYHDYDNWADVLRGVQVYSDDNFEVYVGQHAEFTPDFVESEQSNKEETFFKIEVEIIFKNWDDIIQEQINSAYSKYEKEYSKVRLEKMKEKRAEILSGITEKIQEESDKYEKGELTSNDVRAKINNIFYRIESYDSEIAYLSAVAGEAFPSFEPTKISIKTENVQVELYEEKFEYRFSSETQFAKSVVRQAVGQGNYDLSQDFKVSSTTQVQMVKEDVMFDDEGNIMREEVNQELKPVARQEEEGLTSVEKEQIVNIIEEEVAKEIEKAKKELHKEKTKIIQELKQQQKEVISGNNVEVRRTKSTGERNLRIQGLRPRLKLSVDLTEAEILRLAEELKAKWISAKEEGLIEQMVYNINLAIDDHQTLGDAVRKLGDMSSSIRMTFKNETVFALNFQTKDGRLDSVDYDAAEGAGSKGDNILIQFDFASIMKLRNWWEMKLKNAEGFGEVITAVPSFLGQIIRMILSGEIQVKPISVILKVGDFMSVLFGGLLQGMGANI